MAHSVKPDATKESKVSTRGECPQLEAILCSAQGVDSLRQEGGVTDWSEARSRRYGSKGEISGVCLVNLFIVTTLPSYRR